MNFSYTNIVDLFGQRTLTTIEGLDIPGRTFSLELNTSKGSRGAITSRATVFEHKDGFKTTILFGDYSKTISTSPAPRATEKALIAAHEKALERFPAALIEAHSHTMRRIASEAEQQATQAANRHALETAQA